MTSNAYTPNAEGINKTFWPAIDPVRVALAIVIVILHTNYLYVPQGYLAVEIFFIISGFLIASRKQSTSGVFPRFITTISSIYPAYLASIILTAVILPLKLNDFIIAISLLQAIGLNDNVINTPTWFLTCYLWAGLLYSFLRASLSDRNLYATSMLIAIIGYTCLFALTPAHGLNYTIETTIGFLPPSIVRALAGIGLGVGLYAAYQHIPRLRVRKSIATLIELFVIASCFYIAFRRPISVEMDTSFLPLGFLLIYLLAAEQGLISKFCGFLGQKYKFWRNISFDLFIFHFPLLLFTNKIAGYSPTGIIETFCTILALCLGSIALGFIVRAAKPAIHRLITLQPSPA